MREAARRLSNKKTITETGLAYVIGSLSLHSPYGNTLLRTKKPYFPGEEKELESEFDRLEEMMEFTSNNPKETRALLEALCLAKDISGSVKRSEAVTLSVVEIFEIKAFLLLCEEIRKLIGEGSFELLPVSEALDILDPKGDRINTFYIYDEFSDKLSGLREEKKALDQEIRKIQRAKKEKIKSEYGISLTPKFDIVIPKSSDDVEKAKKIEDLEIVAEDYSQVTFALKPGDETFALLEKVDDINMAIEEEEEACCVKLSREIWKYSDLILENGRRIGYLDLMLAKAIFSENHKLVRPKLLDEYRLSIKNGRHLQVESILSSRGKEYCPISMNLEKGVTCITGANMGGKTVSLKLAGLIMMMAQYGLFVPAEEVELGLSQFVGILIGDSQSMERGLSSFGSEMEELKDILSDAKDRSLILIDEIASGTNPSEGQALTESLIDYLAEKNYICLITTHFDIKDERAENLQVRGLIDADFRRLNSELSGADRNARIDIIGKYMDYTLTRVEAGGEVPRDALNIASMLGLPREIIDGAREHLEEDER